ncbi:hypothetical protein NI531_17690 [Proteus penneri]|nr:hypothetical protein [Proteus penneri]MCO8052556.1 hypothetical protein [Proteus penneri]
MIYTTGTVNTVSGSAIVRGTGTKFKNNNPAINIGMTILIKSGNTNIPYMIKSVNSDTELVLAQPALATATNTTFSIHITEPDNNSDAARTMVAINAYTQYFLDSMNTWMTQTGQTKIEMPNGEVVTLDSIKKMQGDISKKADLASKESQIFKGQVISHSGIYSFDGNNYKTYFGLLRANTGDPFGFYCSYDGAGYSIRMPQRMGGDVVLCNSGGSPNIADNRFLLFRADKENQAAYMEYQKPDGSQRWRVGSMGNNTNIALTTGSGGSLVLDSTNCTVNGKEVVKVTDFGIGANKLVSENRFDDFGTGLASGFYSYVNPKQIPDGVTAYGNAISIQYDQQNWQKLIFSNYGAYFHVQRCINGSRSTVQVMTKDMWTVDSNGFYKRASPIININPDGTFTTNDESEGATVTRIAQGAYLIKGVLGFNADAGWGGVDGGIEIPLDVNKQPLIWVNSEVNKDGSILVKTYHRTHPNAPEFANNDIDGFNDGDPIDIPDGRFISVRVQMPEQSIYNVRMREMEEAQKAEEERRQKEEEMKAQFGLGENDVLL